MVCHAVNLVILYERFMADAHFLRSGRCSGLEGGQLRLYV